MHTQSNRHPVDRLADVRAQMKALKALEDDLKAEVSKEMGGRDSLGGDQYIARQKLSERAGAVDAKAMKAAGIDVDAYRKPPVTVMTITVEERVEEAA
jgi:hypothetical protein